MLLCSDIEATDYRTIKTDAEKQIMILEGKLAQIADEKEEFVPIRDKAVNSLAKLDRIYQDATTIKKRQIVGSIFPEKLILPANIFEPQN